MLLSDLFAGAAPYLLYLRGVVVVRRKLIICPDAMERVACSLRNSPFPQEALVCKVGAAPHDLT